MILRRISIAIRRQDWFAVAVELAVVVTGILIAFQVDQWAQARHDRVLERDYLHRLRDDLEIERQQMKSALGYARDRVLAVRLLERLADDPSAAIDQPAKVSWAIETASWRSFPRITAFVYRELQSTGAMTLLRSVELRRMLAEHYQQSEREARVGEDLNAQRRFDAATAGLLAVDELIALENAAGKWAELHMTPQRARAVAGGFAARSDAIAELPGLAQHHTFNQRVIGDMQRRADRLISRIDRLLADGGSTAS